MNAAARVISGTRKFDGGLTRLLHDDLPWLDTPQRITFKLSAGVQVFTRLCTAVSCRATYVYRSRTSWGAAICAPPLEVN